MKELFIKYINRECSEEEMQQIVSYFQNSKDFSDVPTIKEISHLLDKYPNMEEASANRISKEILDTVRKEQTSPTKTKFHIWSYAAAAIIVGLLLTTTYFLKDNVFNTPIDTTPTIVNNNNIEVGTDKAILTLEDGSVLALEKGNTYETKNANSNGEQIVYEAGERNSTEIVYNYLTIPRGGQFSIKLSDGTQVWLNSESQLKYPVSFIEGETRKVELVYGEAYFDVSPSTKHKGAKFKVFNQYQEVEVFGTEFNIKAYKDETNVYTTLVEGKVSVNLNNKKQNLVPNQQSNFNTNNNSLTINTVDDVYSEISWKEGVFAFKQKSLKEIMKVLSRWYDIEVVFKNESLERAEFIGSLGKDQKIEEILLSIKYFGIIKNYEINDKKVILE